MNLYSSGKHDHLTTDPYPWQHPNGGRIPRRYGGTPFDVWAPRTEFDRPLTNPANGILKAFRASGMTALEYQHHVLMLGFPSIFHHEIEHARAVLQRLTSVGHDRGRTEMSDDIEAEQELLILRHEIADATGYVMRNGKAWAPCTMIPLRSVVQRQYAHHMSTPFSDLRVISSVAARYDSASDEAYRQGTCPGCAGTQLAVIAYLADRSQLWLRCVTCKIAIVTNETTTSPGVRPLTLPLGLPDTESRVWEEARDCLSVGAYTAAVMLCRKLLFHTAVTHGLPAKNDKDRAPSFIEAVKHLEAEELITKKMRPWVDRIKDVGNDANHEITPIDESTALDVAKFTEQLLRLAYEMDALMAGPESEDGDAALPI